MRRFKDLRVTYKLLLIVVPAVISMAVLLTFFNSRINTVYEQSKATLYDEAYIISTNVLDADRSLCQAELAEKELIFSVGSSDKSELVSSYESNIAKTAECMKTAVEDMQKNDELYTQYTVDGGKTLKELYETFTEDFNSWQKLYDVKTGSGNAQEKTAKFDSVRSSLNEMTSLLSSYAQDKTSDLYDSITKSNIISIIVIALVIALIAAASVYITLYIRKNINYVADVNTAIADGELTLEIDENRISADEIGQLCLSTSKILQRLNGYVDYINEITDVLNTMANGDMRVELQLDYFGEFAAIKEALIKISSSLNVTLNSIATSSQQVNLGAQLVSNSAQSLAQGASVQTDSINELVSSVGNITQTIQKNAHDINDASEYVEQVSKDVDRSNECMKQMLDSMEDIKAKSDEIGNIIKAIDDIAFQTNILALNAAVESARAGEAGKGFAVVADEVRTLAGKSAQAAKQTAGLIEQSISAVANGSKIATQTADALENVADKTQKISSVMQSIDAASDSQAMSIEQIKSNLDQISQVIQANSATAQESAAASEELNGQAHSLNNEISKFRLDENTSAVAYIDER